MSIPRRLNLGCGRDRRPDCLNVDVNPAVEPELLWNLDQHPYPLPDGHFDEIYALDVVEHLENVPAFMEDVHRLLAPGGWIKITTPHFSCANAFTDPTHRRALGVGSFDYFTAGSPWSFYSPARFEIAESTIVFYPSRFNRLVAWAANRWPVRYERRFAWIFPAWFLIFRLVARKDGEG